MSLIVLSCILIFAIIIIFPTILHLVYRAPRVVETGTPDDFKLPYSEHKLKTIGDKNLFAWHITAQGSKATLIIVHGWGGNAEMMLPLAQPFHKAGMDLLLYDARNHGKSDSDSFSSLPRFSEDLDSAITWIKQKSPEHRLIVLGHSIGAAAAILSASKRSDIDSVIGVSGFAHPNLVMNRHLDKPWLPRPLREIIMSYIQWVIGFRFDDIAPMNRIVDVRCPVLLAHGTDDRVVPISDMKLIEANATKERPIEVIAIEGAQHDSVDCFHDHADMLVSFIHDNVVEL
ncbi:MAG: alpha/beta fold hydrolase [Candidatus Thiodiazotropha sp. 6PLUC2]